MKKLFILTLVCIMMIGCGKKEPEISPETMKKEMSEFTGGEVKELPVMEGYIDSLDNKQYEGFCVQVNATDPLFKHSFIKSKRATYKKSGYLLFAYMDDKYKEYIAAIKTSDELDIVRWRKTDGINYGLANKDVVSKLQQWNVKYPLEVLEVGRDLVWIRFEQSTTEIDVKAFAEEAYEFCPDVIDQGAGDIPTLIRTIVDMNGIYLWWD